MASVEFSDAEIEQLQHEYERKVRLSAAQARLRAGALAPAQPAPRAGAVPGFPPEPDLGRSIEILLKYAVEAIAHLPDSAGLVFGILRLVLTPEGQELLERLREAIEHHVDDPKLFREIIQFLGGGAAGYGSFLLGVETGGHAGSGVIYTTGVALPTRGDGPVKWFSGMQRSKGPIAELSANILIGQRIETPHELTGQFYGGHTALEVGISLGSTLLFDTSQKLTYQGFDTTIGAGIGGGLAVVWGFEMVTSD